MVKPQEGRQHGHRPGRIQGPEEGQARLCRKTREPHRQSPEQDKGRKVPRLQTREGRPSQRAEKEGPLGHCREGASINIPSRTRNARLHNHQQAKEEARIARERKELAYQRDHAYDEWNAEEQVMASSNQNRDSDWEDDFM
jgi:hypothetical protein